MPHPSNTASPAAHLCPLCGQPNQCAMDIEHSTGIKQAECWCTQVQFSQNLLDKIPAAAKNLACVCAACAKANQA